MPIDPNNFQKSITRELVIIKNRVRDLIGDANWGEEGRYKEAVLKNVIRKFLPNDLSVGTGFIVQGDNSNDNHTIISTQQDIIVYDNTIPVLFSEGDFIITTQHNVRGIIEVKTKVFNANSRKNSLMKVIEKFNRLSIFNKISNIGNNRIFKGIFSFDYDNDIQAERVEAALRVSNGMVNHISLGKNYFIRHWLNRRNLFPRVDCRSHFYNIYEIEDLSFSYFISNLLHIAAKKDLDDRYWFSFPIQGTKERGRIRTICFDERNHNDE